MERRHGGDIYGADLTEQPLDFSASINPLGMPEAVHAAAVHALEDSMHYPDPFCRALRAALAQREGVSPEEIFCGGGAADVLYRLMLTLRPKKVWMPVPTFGEYAQAAQLAGAQVVTVPLRPEDNFTARADIWDALTSDIDLVVLCTPNNPTGRTMDKGLVKKGLERCREIGAWMLADVCFQDFLDEPEQAEFGDLLSDYPLILLKSLTKMYAMPGLRVGYCMCADTGLMGRLYDAGAPWSVSVVAQACGIAAARDDGHAARTRAYIAQQRARLVDELRALGFVVIEGQANYILFRNDHIPALVQRLRARGILVRDCGNFTGLDARWIRIAVRTEAENFVLLHALRQLAEGG